MSDELEDRELEALRAAFKRRAPAPDPDIKAAHLRLAAENFDRLHAATQETAPEPRPMSDRPAGAGFLTGVHSMLHKLTSRQALAATTSIAALALGVIIVLPTAEKGVLPSKPGIAESPTIPSPIATAEPEPKAAAADEGDATTSVMRAQDEPVEQVEAESQIAETGPADLGQIAETDALSRSDDAAATTTVVDEASERTRADALATPKAAPAEEFAATGAAQGLAAQEAAPAGSMADTLSPTIMPAPMPEAADAMIAPEPNTEAFANAGQNPLKITAETPVSTFSIDVDTASYAIVRSSLMNGTLPPPEAVRIEEMVNYFPYSYPAPASDGAPFRPTVTVVPTPWNKDTRLVHVAVQGRLPALEDRPPLNLVFLIDTSGSMEDANKLPLLVQSFRLMLGQLRPQDQVAIVTYAGSAGLVLEPTPASDRATIESALTQLSAGGSTAGQEGLQQAYAVAAQMAEGNEVTRVILATDGDFNVGLSDPEALETFIAEKRASGTYLSVLGFGRGNLDDATMQALAQAGNGQAAYIDTLAEAQKVMVDQLTGALFPIADDVKIQVEWNPATVAEYRLIGYETRALKREDFNNDKVDAGEIGAGHTVTAVYEVTPVGSPAQLSDPLRYQPETVAEATAELGFLKLRYKEPGASESVLLETPIRPDVSAPSEDVRFAAAIAGFGQLLTGSTYLGDWSYADAIALATEARGTDPFGYRTEAVTLMRLAQTLAD